MSCVVATPEAPGTNFAITRDGRPHSQGLASVADTGVRDNERLHIRRSMRPPKRRPPAYQTKSAISAAIVVTATSGHTGSAAATASDEAAMTTG